MKFTGKKIEGGSEGIQKSVIEISKEGEDENPEGSAYEEIIKKQRKFKLFGHSDAVFSISLSIDKKYIVSGSYDETIRLWSIFTRSTLAVYRGHFSPVLCVKFSPFT